MSSLYVRELCAQWASGLAVPYYNTINEEQRPTDALWFTLDFQSLGTVQETYCNTRESGEVVLLFFGQAGTSYETTMEQALPVVTEFFANIDSAGRLTLEMIGAPSDYGTLDAPWYGVEWSVTYTYR
jgi:hypothetical protein